MDKEQGRGMLIKSRTFGMVATACAAMPMTSHALSESNWTATQMEVCAASRDSSRRLSCFDGLFERSVVANSPEPPELIEGHGNWVGVKKQRIQGRISSALLLPIKGLSIAAIYEPGGNYKSDSFLRVDCSHGGQAVYLHWPRDLGHRDIALDLVFDRGRSGREIWKVTLDGNVVKPTSNEDRRAFIKSIWMSNTLKVSIPRNGMTQQYDLSGFQGMSKAMKDECTWVDSM